MNTKGSTAFIRPTRVLVAGIVLAFGGLATMAVAASTYRGNLHRAAVQADTAANIYRVDVGCLEDAP